MAKGPDAQAANAMMTAWNGSTALTALVPGGLHKDKLVKPASTPYARLEVKEQAGRNVYSSGGRYIDYREVAITIYGVGDIATGDIVAAVQALYDNQVLTFGAANVSHMRTEPLGVTVAQEDEIKSGEEYRAAKFRWSVWTDRIPGS